MIAGYYMDRFTTTLWRISSLPSLQSLIPPLRHILAPYHINHNDSKGRFLAQQNQATPLPKISSLTLPPPTQVNSSPKTDPHNR